jgi:hypothetical protein
MKTENQSSSHCNSSKVEFREANNHLGGLQDALKDVEMEPPKGVYASTK